MSFVIGQNDYFGFGFTKLSVFLNFNLYTAPQAFRFKLFTVVKKSCYYYYYELIN